jgi:hypothetical protein
VDTSDQDFCGSSGCPTFLYGLRNGKYQVLLDDDLRGYVSGMAQRTNGYKDVLLGSRYGVTIYKFDGAKYHAFRCFSREDDNPDYRNPPYEFKSKSCS